MSLNADTGVRAFSKALRIIRRPALRRFIVLPALVSLLIIATGSWFTLGYLTTLAEAFANWLPDWLSFLDAVLAPLLYLIGILVAAWVFALLAVLISSPFLGLLSAAVERELGVGAHQSGASVWVELISSLGREGRKLIYHLPRLLLVFVITLIPAVNVVSPLLWLLFGAWTLAVQFCDYPGENRGLPFADTLRRLKANRAAALSFGLCASLAMAIPLLNFLLIPVAVAGGTLLMREMADQP